MPIFLVVLAIAEPVIEPEVELAPGPFVEVEPVALRDDYRRPTVAAVLALGAYKLPTAWVAVATLGIDLAVAVRRIELHLMPHVTVSSHDELSVQLGLDGSVVLPLSDVLAIGIGTDQVVGFSRGRPDVRIGPTLRPFMVRTGPHRITVTFDWLAVRVSGDDPAPVPFYTVGYGLAF